MLHMLRVNRSILTRKRKQLDWRRLLKWSLLISMHYILSVIL